MIQPQREPAVGQGSTPEFVSVWRLAAGVVRNRKTVLASWVTGAAAGLAWALLSTAHFTSTAIIRPASSEVSGGQLSALAAQFGVSVAGGAERDSPELYSEIISSRPVLDSLVARSWTLSNGASVTLREVAEIEEQDEALAHEKVLRWLRKEVLSTETSRTTGSLRVMATTPDALLSRAVAVQVLVELEQFNTAVRQTQAAAERRFAEAQFTARAAELRASEDTLRVFLERNRNFTQSPELQFARDRLARSIELRQQVVVTLGQAVEQARLAEVRNTPRILVLQRPNLPVEPDRRMRLLKLMALAFVGLVAGLGLAVARELSAELDTSDALYREEVRSWLRQLRRW